MTHELEDLVYDFYERRLQNDASLLKPLFTDATVIRLAGTGARDVVAPSRASDALDATVDAMVSNWRWEEQKIETLITTADTVAVHYRLRTVHVPTGETIETELADFIRIENGKIVEFVEFVDTATAAALAARTG